MCDVPVQRRDGESELEKTPAPPNSVNSLSGVHCGLTITLPEEKVSKIVSKSQSMAQKGRVSA